MDVEDIRNICKEMASVTEDIKWEHDLVFSVGGKMFCVVGIDDSPTNASFKVREEEFEEICTRNGFAPAPYVARYKWVLIDNITKMNKKEWRKYITQSYKLVKEKLPAKLKKQLGII